jgi:hypothetical protein
MKLKVKEIIEWLDTGKLRTEQTTQRRFIYQTMEVNLFDGTITRAGNVLKSILQHHIQLPALYFWERDGKYNIHDGKQRILSIYYFIKPTPDISVVTNLHGKEVAFSGLTAEQKQYLLDYEFDIVVVSGDQEKEETTFYLINTNAVPLTPYEALRGMFYGTFLYEFESYLEAKAKMTDKIKQIGRGEQAILFLYNCFKLLGEKENDKRIRKFLESIRNNSFNSKLYKLDETVGLFSELLKILTIPDSKALEVAALIIRKGYDKDRICDYFRQIIRRSNDVKRWNIDTFTTAINNLINNNIECDGKRFFTDNDKDLLYARSQRCAGLYCNENNYKKLEVDHITKWSKGGKTILDNARLLCKSCNSSGKYN